MNQPTAITVKCFSELEKNLIVRDYMRRDMNLKQIAEAWQTSPRTINRVLTERGLATPVPRLKGEAYQVMQLLKDYGIKGVEDLQPILHQYVVAKVNSTVSSIGYRTPALLQAQAPARMVF